MSEYQENYHYTETHITEKRAPTDQSIRLLNEFQEKARLNIVNSIEATDNNLNIVGVYFSNQLPNRNVDFYAMFKLNGKEFRVKKSVDSLEWRRELMSNYSKLGHSDIFNLVHKTLADGIAWELMRQSPDFLRDIKENNCEAKPY